MVMQPQETAQQNGAVGPGFDPLIDTDAPQGYEFIPGIGQQDQAQDQAQDQQDGAQQQQGGNQQPVTLTADEYAEFQTMRQESMARRSSAQPQREQFMAEQRTAQDAQIRQAAMDRAQSLMNGGVAQETAVELSASEARVATQARDAVYGITDRGRAIAQAISGGYPAEEALALFDNPRLRTADDIQRATGEYQNKAASTSQDQRIKQLEAQVEALTKGQGLAGQSFGGPTTPLGGGGAGSSNQSLDRAIKVTAQDGYVWGSNPDLERLFDESFGK